MSTRIRSRSAYRSYTTRLHQRAAAPGPARQWPAWLTTRQLPSLLAVLVEGGHLATALLEWPAATPRGVFHVLAAAALGLVAVGVYFGPTRIVLALGIGLSALLPVAWLVGALAGATPYRELPLGAALGLTAAEVVLTGLLAGLLVELRQVTTSVRPVPHGTTAHRGTAPPRATTARGGTASRAGAAASRGARRR